MITPRVLDAGRGVVQEEGFLSPQDVASEDETEPLEEEEKFDLKTWGAIKKLKGTEFYSLSGKPYRMASICKSLVQM